MLSDSLVNYPTLTRVEKLVLRGTSYGLSYEEIARGLGITNQTVGREVADAYTKMQVAVRMGVATGLGVSAAQVGN